MRFGEKRSYAGHVLTKRGQYFSTSCRRACRATRCSVADPIRTDTFGFARTLSGHGFGRSDGDRTLQTTRSSPSRKKMSGIVRGRPDRRPVAVSKRTGSFPVSDTRPPVASSSHRCRGETTCAIAHVPGRVAPIPLTNDIVLP